MPPLPYRFIFQACSLALVAICSAPALAGGDVVEFGDSRMVGEVKRLARGKLYFKTDSTETIEIDWADVTRLVTKQTLRVERRNGRVSFASFGAEAQEARLAVQTPEGVVQESVQNIVAFEQFEDGFWNRLDVTTSLGYSFTKSNGVQQFTFAAGLSHDDEKRSREMTLSSQHSESDGADPSTRRMANYQSLRYSDSRYFTGWKGSYESNDALGLDYRVLAAWLAGREFYPLANQRVRLLAGIDLSEERSQGTSDALGSELVFGGAIDWYKFRSPQLDLSSMLTIFPSLTDSGRVRAKFDIRLRWELYEDLFWELSVYDDYDSRSPSVTGDDSPSRNDYGVTTGLGWSW